MLLADVSRETRCRIVLVKELILHAADQQNLIARSTREAFDDRHINDSLQLLAAIRSGPVADIGSGGGLPGLILACALPTPVHLIEPRKMRADFLRSAADTLRLDHVTVHQGRVESVAITGICTITARAVAPLPRLFAMAAHLANEDTRWVLPKGQSAAEELAEAREMWQGRFTLLPSVTDPRASIIVAEGVRRR